MLLLIRQFNPDGAIEQRFDAEEITLGRATGCSVELPGLAVALRHARLIARPDGALGLESLCPIGVELNGTPGVQTADLKAGDVMRIGGHRLCLASSGNETILEVELTDPLGVRGTAAHTTLAQAGMRMRGPALLLALLVLVAGLALPLTLRWWRAPPALAAALPTEQFWLPGVLANAHRHLGADCGSCHKMPFISVEDSTCLGCHQGIAQHSDNPAILTTGGIDGRRCASCHREHQGDHGVVPSHPGVCTDCHAKPERFEKFADLRMVSDFGSAHPEFRPTITVAGKQARVPLNENPRDQSGLLFPHDLHLKADGLRGPKAKEHLLCTNCHRFEAAATTFEPIQYETHCQRCHQLDVEAGASPLRLPHGDDALAWTALQNYSRAHPLAAFKFEPIRRRRPGTPAGRPAPVTTADVMDEVFETRVCGRCHETVRMPDKPIATRPLTLRDSFLPHAHFTHAAHAWQHCADCHDAQKSAAAQDVLLPDINSCRNCHGGVDSNEKIRSTCVDCHRFHDAAKLQFGSATGAKD